MSSFQFLFERISTIPIGILVEPLVKAIQVSEGSSFKFNVFDFDFFKAIVRHPRINLKNGVMVSDLMAKAFLNERLIDF